jgi:histidinol dehydrogenase
MGTGIIRIYDVDSAQQTILRRRLGLGADLPQSVGDGIKRIFGEVLEPAAAVALILEDVRKRGDSALSDWTSRIDGVTLESLSVSPAEIARSLETLDGPLREALELAAGRIRRFHQLQPLPEWSTTALGGVLGQRVTPLRRVGVYVPGGTAPLPSSLLMSVIPAQVAGVKEIVVATPPSRQNGRVSPVILAAAAIAGIEAVCPLGGAQAIAALAYGTQSIAPVDKIVGPGNLFVTLAKQQVYGTVGIDGLYGPTETVVVADESANAAWVAADMLAQAEHDPLATAILFTPSLPLAKAVQAQLAQQIEDHDRAGIIAAALVHQGGIVLTVDLDQACRLAGDFAAEHTCLAVAEPQNWARKIAHAGGLFLGERSFEVLGDYVAGPSHVMPTGGTARFASPLNVLDFVKITSLVQLDPETSAQLSAAAAVIARAEGLSAHAAAAERRAR